MENRNFLNQKLIVIIKPAIVLLHSLSELMNLAKLAVLTVTEENKIQILTVDPNQHACANLEMDYRSIISPLDSDGFSLVFLLQNWYDNLIDLILLEPSATLLIKKSPGSNDLSCFFGRGQKLVRLGDAKCVKTHPAIHTSDSDDLVRVTMTPHQFTEFIQSFADSGHDHTISAVQLHISRETISWITPAGHHDHSAQEYEVEGFEAATGFQFGVRWDWPLFQRLCLMANNYYEHVAIYAFECTTGKMYGFRFLDRCGSHCFTYREKELVF